MRIFFDRHPERSSLPLCATVVEGPAFAFLFLAQHKKWVPHPGAPTDRSSSVGWIQAPLGWDSTDRTNPQVEFVILRSPRRPKDPRLLLALSIQHKKWVPHPSSAWVG